MARQLWELSPVLSGAVVGGVMVVMTAWPKKIWDWEKKNPKTSRFIGLVMATIVFAGAIAAYQQQLQMATKDDIKDIPTREYVDRGFKELESDLGNKVDKINPKAYIFKAGDFEFSVNERAIPIFRPGNAPTYETLPSVLKVEMSNRAHANLSGYLMDLRAASVCEMSSENPEWSYVPDEGKNHMIWRSPPASLDEDVPAGVTMRFPEVKVHCSDDRANGLILVLHIKSQFDGMVWGYDSINAH